MDTFQEERQDHYKQEELEYISGLDIKQWDIEAIDGGLDADSPSTRENTAPRTHSL